MPLFTYLCKKCEQTSEILVRTDDAPTCPHCGSSALAKQASAFAPVAAAQRKVMPPAGCDGSACCGGGGCPYQ